MYICIHVHACTCTYYRVILSMYIDMKYSGQAVQVHLEVCPEVLIEALLPLKFVRKFLLKFCCLCSASGRATWRPLEVQDAPAVQQKGPGGQNRALA